ncbi:hypothetical protein [Streptomyces sp. DH37]|uniref:hypothetical protein n=1 Tax=Streptomyces sp. DH37 TaxID=3040122 RepID=UPI0024430B29|nr:hypothetical protein [Streptomyces sp. DH37]MDG9705982.1 hypothetical protein [Streptomyces sp. DH37]
MATLVLDDGPEGSSRRYRREDHHPEVPCGSLGWGGEESPCGPCGPCGPAEPLGDCRVEFRVCARAVPEPSLGIPSRWAPLDGSSTQPRADYLRGRGITPGPAG